MIVITKYISVRLRVQKTTGSLNANGQHSFCNYAIVWRDLGIVHMPIPVGVEKYRGGITPTLIVLAKFTQNYACA